MAAQSALASGGCPERITVSPVLCEDLTFTTPQTLRTASLTWLSHMAHIMPSRTSLVLTIAAFAAGTSGAGPAAAAAGELSALPVMNDGNGDPCDDGKQNEAHKKRTHEKPLLFEKLCYITLTSPVSLLASR